MSISDHMTTFAGRKVVEWTPGTPFDPAHHAVRIALDWDAADEGSQWVDRFTEYLEHPGAFHTTALIVGNWGESSGTDSAAVVEALVSMRAKLPKLEALFLGDITGEECEISWLNQSDVGPLFQAYPALRVFGVRGGTSLTFGAIRHPRLQSLIIETGGLDVAVVRQVLAADLPELNHLELWLGDPGYGATATIDDLQPLFTGSLFPKLTYLGLRNSEFSDKIAAAIASSPLLGRIEVLDLSLGTLGDEGARALAAAPQLSHLKKLDIHHHYVSKEGLQLLKDRGIPLDASEQEKPDEWNGESHRYVAVGE